MALTNDHILKGINFVTTATTEFAADTLYFVRTNDDKTDGYLYMNGKKYGTGKDVETAINNTLGSLSGTSYETFKAYIDAVSGVTSANTSEINTIKGEFVKSVNGVTGNTVVIDATEIKMNKGEESGQTVSEAIAAVSASAFVDVAYDSSTKKIQLKTSDGTTYSTGFDASAFVVDGMLSDAKLVTTLPENTTGHDGENGPWIHLTWILRNRDEQAKETYNTEKEMYVNVQGLVDVYTEGSHIQISGNTISALTGENHLALHNDLVAVSGATTANTAAIELLNSGDTTEGSVDYKIKTAIDALDSEVVEGTASGDGNYVKSVVQENGKVTVEYAALPTETEVTATGDTLISASASGHSVTVESTNELKAAVSAATTAVQSVNGISETAVTITSDNVKIGTEIVYGEGTTAVTIATTDSSITEAISSVIDQMVDNEFVTAEAINDLNARVSGNTDEINTIKQNYVQSVNGSTGTSVDIKATAIKVGAGIKNNKGEDVNADTTVNTTINDIYAQLSASTAALTIASSDKTIDVTTGATGTNIEVNIEEATDETVSNGHSVEIKANTNGALYGQILCGGDDWQ